MFLQSLLYSFLFSNAALLAASTQSQSPTDYLEKIRHSQNLLTAFFSNMPKGGDLHHHYSGSVYAETYLQYALQKDLYFNPERLTIAENADEYHTKKMSDFSKDKNFILYQEALIKKWSIKDYLPTDGPSDKHFFSTFPAFTIPSNRVVKEGLLELKQRAKLERVAYIETMLNRIPTTINMQTMQYLNADLRTAQQSENATQVKQDLNTLYVYLKQQNYHTVAQRYNDSFITPIHSELKIDDSDFTMRYQNYVLRFMSPIEIFRDMLIAFESANTNPLVVGVNIVAPENNEISMQDYWLHMQMYQFCHVLYPKVKYALHAGELALGLVKPEELTWHIHDAVYTANASRIGHGVDIAHETKCYDLLKTMKEKKIAVEINLTSNEFILHVKEDKHPIMLYYTEGVPVVISSDDAGVLRTNLTEQYVLLAKRYPYLSYLDIKEIVLNSIRYSFIKETALKERILSKIQLEFKNFESLFY